MKSDFFREHLADMLFCPYLCGGNGLLSLTDRHRVDNSKPPTADSEQSDKHMRLQQIAYRASSLLRHRLTAWNTGGEGIHSPYLFYWVRHCLYDRNRYYAFDRIEKQRSALLHSTKTLTVTDYGTGKDRHATRQVKDIAATSLEKARNAQTLFRLVQFIGDKELDSQRGDEGLHILELGTSLGITTAYLASPSSKNKVVTMEGSESLTATARDNWQKLGLHNITAVEGNIDETLHSVLTDLQHVDLVFMDANHTEAATLRYWEAIVPHVGKKSVIVLDDIHWNKEMERAWRSIQQDKRVTCTMDTYDMGMTFFDPAYLHKHFRLRI